MKHFLSVSGLILMLLSGCAALPAHENNENVAAASDVQAASDVSVPQAASDVAAPNVQAASQVAKPETVTIADDVKVLPIGNHSASSTQNKDTAKNTTTTKKTPNNKEKNDKTEKNTSPAKLNVTLRNQPKVSDNKAGNKNAKTTSNNKNATTAKGKTAKAPVVTLPPPKPAKPVLTRRQILEQEVTRERAALKTAQTQLAAAKKSGNAKQIAKLNAAVRDRELNVRAIEAEIKR